MKKLMTVEEIANILQVHEKTIKRYLRKGEIAGVKIGNNWRVTEEQLQNYLSANTTLTMKKVKQKLMQRVSNLESGKEFSVKSVLKDVWNKVPNPKSLGKWFIQEIKSGNIKGVIIEDKASDNLQMYTKK